MIGQLLKIMLTNWSFCQGRIVHYLANNYPDLVQDFKSIPKNLPLLLCCISSPGGKVPCWGFGSGTACDISGERPTCEISGIYFQKVRGVMDGHLSEHVI